MRVHRLSTAVLSVAMFTLAGAAIAADDAAPAPAPAAKPVIPALSDTLTAWGLSLNAYVDATFGYSHDDSETISGLYNCYCKTDYNSFALNQAAFTLAVQPTTGFGALVNVVAGSNPYNGIGNGELVGSSNTLNQSAPLFYLMQAFGQYAVGPWTFQAGKFATLAGAEVFAPTGNTNVTRSILFNYEPVTNTGVRATYAASDKLSLILGVNNGWTASQDLSDGSEKTVEFGLSLTPNKMWSWTLQGYYGRDTLAWNVDESSVKGGLLLLDTVLTWNATSAITVIGSVDYGNVGSTSSTPSASWWGVAGYFNYAINDLWRVSLRGEYFDDADGYETGSWTNVISASPPPYGSTIVATTQEKLQEVTLTLGYDPSKHFELRAEGRADFPSPSFSPTVPIGYQDKTYQFWLEALYKL